MLLSMLSRTGTHWLSSSELEPIPEPVLNALRAHFAADGARLQRLCGVRVPWAAPPTPPPRPRSSERPTVSIVILAHDSPSELEALLASIVDHTTDAYEILVVENGSSPTGCEAHASLAARYGAQLIPLSENLAFSVANNIGVAASRGEELMLVNSDVVVTAGWLGNMRTALHSESDIGAVGPRTNFAPGPQGGIWLDDSTPAGVQEYGRSFNHSDPTRWFEIEWLAGFAMLVRRTAFEAIGGFDESVPWFAGEDLALSQALRFLLQPRSVTQLGFHDLWHQRLLPCLAITALSPPTLPWPRDVTM